MNETNCAVQIIVRRIMPKNSVLRDPPLKLLAVHHSVQRPETKKSVITANRPKPVILVPASLFDIPCSSM